MQLHNTRHDAYWAIESQDQPFDDLIVDMLDDSAVLGEVSAAAGCTPDGGATDMLTAFDAVGRLKGMAIHNALLREELSNAYARLNVVLELSEKASSFDNHDDLETDLLTRYANTLSASALLIDDGEVCRRVNFESGGADALALTPEEVRATLGVEIAETRRSRRAVLISREKAEARGWNHGYVMLSPLQEDTCEPHVIIAVREYRLTPFADNDRLASETLLVYGGHILHNALMLKHLKRASFETVGALANAIEARDKYTGGHSERVGYLAALTGQALGLPGGEIQMLEWAGWLHDVGKIGIPENILNKPGGLTQVEFDHIKQHPILGYEVLQPVSSLKPVLEAVLYHHENWDGTGYPEGLAGEHTPLPARILHVVDIFDALTSTRSYRRQLDVERALNILEKNSGSITDPTVTSAFIEAFRAYQHDNPEGCAAQFSHL